MESQSILVKVEIDDLGTNTLLSLALLLFCCGAFMSVDPGFRLSVPPVVDAFDFEFHNFVRVVLSPINFA